MPHLDELTQRLHELAHLKSALSVLYWDSEVNMPTSGVAVRAQTISYLTQILHEKFLDPEFETLLRQAHEQSDLSPHEQAMVREVKREFEREKKLPTTFVKELAGVTAQATHVWARARHESNFSLFKPYLERIIRLKRQEADFVGFKDSPYDALVDVYEPYLTTAEVYTILEELKDFLVPFLERLRAASVQVDPAILHGQFPIPQQQAFNQTVATFIGFNFEAGRLDSSTHPFSVGFHPDDVRLTTRYYEDDVISALMSSLHEAGHGLYEQGLERDHFGTPLGETASTGIHESQSRLWENLVGRSRPFWQFLYPRLQAAFPEPFKNLPLETFYQALNRVHPSPIRVDADEVTYNLHIILRFEIEKEVIEGSSDVTDLPDIWASKTKDYLGCDLPDAAHGVLQDIHWSNGLIGYFPTYTLGNLYAAQLYHAARQALPYLEDQLAQGQFAPLREWLRTHIHSHGRRYSASELLATATGQPLTSQHFTDYLTQKYSDLYRLV